MASELLENLKAPVLTSNLLFSTEKKLQKSVVFNVKGNKVGVIGFLTPDGATVEKLSQIEYVDEVIAVKEEVEKLQAQGVNAIIALGHSGTDKDLEIAREVDGIDLVISGFNNVYSWDLSANANDIIENTETVITQASGKKVPFIYSHAYNQYLGKIKLAFDADGEITSYNVDPILLDESVPQDKSSVDLVTQINSETVSTYNEVVGETAVVLDGDSCDTEECNLGNLIADSIMYYYAINNPGEEFWSDASIAVIHSGAIQSSIAPANRPASVTQADLLTALPLSSHLVVLTMSGTVLEQFLEHSVSFYSPSNPSGQFLQFSGVRVTYDLSRPPGSRITNAVVRCGTCHVPYFYVIDDWRTYHVIVPAALADGEFGYTMLTGLPRVDLQFDEVTSVDDYIGRRSPVYPEVAGRITLVNSVDDAPPEPETTLAPEPTDAPESTDAPDTTEGPETTDAPDSANGLSFSVATLFLVTLPICFSR